MNDTMPPFGNYDDSDIRRARVTAAAINYDAIQQHLARYMEKYAGTQFN
ncbi:MAG: hypothetical protein AAGL69_16130 [Pseudomonadota bacterium]